MEFFSGDDIDFLRWYQFSEDFFMGLGVRVKEQSSASGMQM